MKSGSLNLLEPSGPHRACYGTALPTTSNFLFAKSSYPSTQYSSMTASSNKANQKMYKERNTNSLKLIATERDADSHLFLPQWFTFCLDDFVFPRTSGRLSLAHSSSVCDIMPRNDVSGCIEKFTSYFQTQPVSFSPGFLQLLFV